MAMLTRDDVQVVEQKLRRFAADLPEQERNVLGWLIARSRFVDEAALQEEDLPANAEEQELAEILGFTNEIGDLSITWSKGSNGT